jgi:hypothetical protein
MGVMTQIIKDFQQAFIYLARKINKPRAAIVVAGIGKIKMLVHVKYTIKPVLMPVPHLLEPVLCARMIADQFPKCACPVAKHFQQFLLNKACDHTMLFIGVSIIKYANLYREIYQFLYKVLDRDALMILFKLLVVFDLSKQYPLHTHVRFYDEWIRETRRANPLFYFLNGQLVQNVNCFWM